MENLNGTSTHNSTDSYVAVLVWYFLPTVVTVPPLAIPANALVIRLLLRKPGICSTSEIFILHLALSDIMFCFMVISEYIRFLLNHTAEAGKFLAWGMNQSGGPMLLCILSLDCYVAVCHPLLFIRLKDPKLRLSLCLLVLVVTAVCSIIAKVSVWYRWNVMFGLLSSATVTITTCNILILKSLCQSGPSNKEVHPVKKRAFKTVLTALVLINIHYLIPCLEYLIRVFGPSQFKPHSFLTSISYLVLSLGSFVQPLCYLVRTKQLPEMRCDRCTAAETKTVATV
ncbi:G-protein coupled receptor 15-like [Centropristis striata]|uniref:G-protein coupled receptor 15-like n=1 Tax=Centropristis striata TaxID=184440 RepID=UPI0027DEC10C|nr:G-protein coupled receptor 15-like [Centropristis striata]